MPYLFVFKKQQTLTCCLLQIIGGTLGANESGNTLHSDQYIINVLSVIVGSHFESPEMPFSAMCGSRGGDRGPDPSPVKNHKNIVSYQFWSRSPEKSQSYIASIQCWAIISTPAKRHLNGVSLAGR